jgi:triphosphoribosyl-dephospho-CoA synthase
MTPVDPTIAAAAARAAERAQAFSRAFITACDLDVAVRKPGNVSHASAGHGMTAALFEASARAAAPALTRSGAGVGVRIEAAMRATLAAAGCNTNLGIVLLAAPLALAWETRGAAEPLRAALERVLAGLGVDDAAAAYRAIALTRPGGLGELAEHDVAAPPSIDLRQAMALAAPRDRIAALYVVTPPADGPYAELFDIGLPAWQASSHLGQAAALRHAWLELLVSAPDTHIVRKHGAVLAHSVMTQARPWLDAARDGQEPHADPARTAWAAWDEALKLARINPGTCADLCVGTALLASLLACPRHDAAAAWE